MTVDEKDSIVEALAVKDGRITTTGATGDIKELSGRGTKVADLGGKTVLPGLVDTRSHPVVAAEVLLQINCLSPPIRSIREILP